MAATIKARFGDHLIVTAEGKDIALDVIEKDGDRPLDAYLTPKGARKLAVALIKAAKKVEASA